MNRTTSSRRRRWFFARAMARAYRELLEKGRKKRRQAEKRKLFAEALEPRVLFSATPAPDPDAANEEQAQDAGAMAHTAELLDAVEQSGVEGVRSIFFAAEETEIQEKDIERLAREAVARWEKSGLTEEQLAALENLNYVVTDLGGSRLGAMEGNTIYLDDDGGGRDWFIDETEWLDEEFAAYDGYWEAITNEAMEGIDLLTVILHEQGHILGLLDLEEADEIDGLMYYRLGEGMRKAPLVGLADGFVPGTLEGRHYLVTTAGMNGNILEIFGDGDDDAVTLRLNGTQYEYDSGSGFSVISGATTSTVTDISIDLGGARTPSSLRAISP